MSKARQERIEARIALLNRRLDELFELVKALEARAEIATAEIDQLQYRRPERAAAA